MNRFGNRDYGHSVFPPFERTHLDPPNIYPFPERIQPIYDDFEIEPWDYDDYRRSLDSDLGGHIGRSRSWVPDDGRRHRRHLFPRSGQEDSGSPDPSTGTKKKRGGNKFDRLFGRRRRDRPNLHGEHNAGQNRPEYDDVDVASLG